MTIAPSTFTVAIFFATEQSEWDPDSLVEGRFDADRAVRRFEDANTRPVSN
jgi:hypothetical protein